MANSNDSRKKLPSQRGAKRTGAIGSILPGDHTEVARDIARIWDELRRLGIRVGRSETKIATKVPPPRGDGVPPDPGDVTGGDGVGADPLSTIYHLPGSLHSWWRMDDAASFVVSSGGATDNFATGACFDRVGGRHLNYHEYSGSAFLSSPPRGDESWIWNDGNAAIFGQINTDRSGRFGFVQFPFDQETRTDTPNPPAGSWLESPSTIGTGLRWGVEADADTMKTFAVWVVAHHSAMGGEVGWRMPIAGDMALHPTGSYVVGWGLDMDSKTGEFTFWVTDASNNQWSIQPESGGIGFDSWNHVAVTYEEGVYVLYLNGANIGQVTAPPAPYTSPGGQITFAKGVYKPTINENEFFFLGSLRDAAVWGVPLTAAQILEVISWTGNGGQPIDFTGPGATEDSGLGGIRSGLAGIDTVLSADGSGGTRWRYPKVKVYANGS